MTVLKELPKNMSSPKIKAATEKIFKDFSKMIQYLKNR